MQLNRLWRLLFGAVALAATACQAQTFPTKPIRVIVPFPPGGADVTLRLLQPKMQEELGQAIVVDNRPGANGIIGSELGAHADPDGYTLLYTTSSTLVSGIFLVKTVPFDPVKDFMPITIVFDSPNILVANLSVPANNLQELIAYAKRNPGKLTYASSSIGSAAHLDGEVLKMTTGIDILHVPFKGFGPAVQEFLAGRVDLLPIPYFVVKGFLAAGKIKALGIHDDKHFPPLPQVSTLGEVAPNFTHLPGWVGMLGPGGLPRPVVNRVRDSIVKALNTPDIRARFNEDGNIIVADTPEHFSATIKSDITNVGKIVKILNIQPE